MSNISSTTYQKGFLPYGFAAFLVGIIGGLSTVLGPAFMLNMNLAYNNTTWTALSQAISTAACAPILGKLVDIFGPSVGGIILQFANWRALMWISTGICIVFFFLCFFTHPKVHSVPQRIANFDIPGSILVIVFFSLLLCVPSFGQNFGWTSTSFLVVLLLALISLVGLFLPVIILFLTQGLMQANMTNTIVFINYTQPDNTIISAYAISIMYLGMSLGSILLGPLSDRFEPKRILTGSLLLTGTGCALMLLYSTTTPFLILASALGILGFGLGANAAIFMKIVLSNLPSESAGLGTGTYGLFRDLAAPFGVAVFVPMFTNEISRLASASLTPLSSSNAAATAIHMLSFIEICCIAIGIFIVQFLPNIYKNNSLKGEPL